MTFSLDFLRFKSWPLILLEGNVTREDPSPSVFYRGEYFVIIIIIIIWILKKKHK